MSNKPKHSHVPIIARRHVAAALVVVLLLGCGDSLVDPQPQVPQQVFFISAPVAPPGTSLGDWHNLKKDIFRMNADGTGLENLTGLPASYGGLSLSPDGTKLAFHSDRDGCKRIWSMNLDGTDLRSLTPEAYSYVRCNYTPKWSPDGTRIAFTTSREGRWSVYVMNSDGSNPRNVSAPLDRVEWSSNWPVGWTPDGKLIFEQWGNGARQAYTVNPDGTGLGPLFGRTGDRDPSWSPDRSKVAFIRDAGETSSLFVMNSDGSDVRKLTNHVGDDELVWDLVQSHQRSSWSPDGKRIAFLNVIDFKAAIDAIGVDGTGHTRLTTHRAGGDVSVDGWTADGRVTFTSGEAGSRDIYVINWDGSGLTKLTGSDTHDAYALWVPLQ